MQARPEWVPKRHEQMVATPKHQQTSTNTTNLSSKTHYFGTTAVQLAKMWWVLRCARMGLAPAHQRSVLKSSSSGVWSLRPKQLLPTAHLISAFAGMAIPSVCIDRSANFWRW